MLGGLGDVLIALCIAWHYAQHYGAPVPFITSSTYHNVLAGCSYVKVVGSADAQRDYHAAITWAHENYPTVYPLHVGKELRVKRTTRFCHEQYLMAGVSGRYGDFPLVFDRRDVRREAKFAARVRNAAADRSLFLYNIHGKTSPFAEAPLLLRALEQRWGSTLQFVNVSLLALPYFQDLLGLLVQSVGMLSIDTATIHLMPASETPYIALVNDAGTSWGESVPRGNCLLQVGYSKAMASLPEIHETIERMLKLKGVTINAPTVEVLPAKPHLLTLATGDMARVWKVASRVWEPWCAARQLALQTVTTSPQPEQHPSWNKIPLLLSALKEHNEVWWIDADVTVARSNVELPISPADLLFASDWNGLCACLFRVRATEWVRKFLEAVLLLGDVGNPDAFGKGCGVKWEQNALKALLRDFPAAAEHVQLMPAALLNDHPEKQRIGSFYHFGARSNTTRIAQMRAIHALS